MLHRVFVDTNCFLHLRDLKDLPWRDVLPGVSDLQIMVAHVVIDELDRLKTEKSSRIRDRCRAALSLIEEASSQDGMLLELRSVPFRISLIVAEGDPIDWSTFPRLDKARPDDELVAAALSDAREGPVTLVSYDTGPLIRARAMKLAAIRSPDTWLLPLALDPAEQKVTRLERELAAAKATRPGITARVLDVAEDGMLRLIMPQLEPLPAPVQKRMLDFVIDQHPRLNVRATNYGVGGFVGIGGIDGGQVAEYHSDYDQFVEASRRQLAELHELMELALRFGEIRLELVNESSVTASRLRLSAECSDNFQLFGSRSDLEKYGGALRRILPPDPPRDRLRSPFLDHDFSGLREPRRDPTGFYWLNRPDAGDRNAALICEEFRATQRFVKSFYLIGPEPCEGELHLEASATNLASPVAISTQVIIAPCPGSWSDQAVLRRLPDWMAEVIGESN